jgi:hypothetical protein
VPLRRLAVWSTERYTLPPEWTYWEVSASVLVKLLVLLPSVAYSLASSTLVSRAVLKGDEGASEMASSTSIVIINVG